jgi:two-component system LytT family response regulator
LETKTILIVDDEKVARTRIVRFLEQFEATNQCSFKILQAINGVEAINMILDCNPNIVFLDIQMPELNGFDVLQQIENKNFQIIFQTAFDEYAVRAFEESACDYLLKPFNQDRFNKALAKALSYNNPSASLQKLTESLQQSHCFFEKIVYKKGGKVLFINTNEIICFKSQDHYTSAFTKNGEYIIDYSIAYLSKVLNPKKFFRCHRSCIVSIDYVQAVGSAKESIIELSGGIKIPVSRNHRSALLKRLQ